MWMYQYMRTMRMIIITVFLLLVAAASIASSPKSITLLPGAVETIKIGNIKRVAVGLDTVAAASVLDTGELLIIARTPGATDIRVWTEGDRPHLIKLTVKMISGKSAAEALRASLNNLDGVSVRDEAGLLIIDGDVAAPVVERVNEIIQALSQAGAIGPNVLNLLYTKKNPNDPMIRMDVRFVEINKGALQKLGIRWNPTMPGFSAGAHRSYTVNPAFRIIPEGSGGMTTNIPLTDQNFYGYFGVTTFTSSIIDMLAEDNQAKTLAAPVLVTQSGTSAKFISGGELPIPILSELGRTTVEYKEYGVKLDVKPVIDAENNITSEIVTEVSSIDPSVNVQGVPGLLKRATTSIISVKPGETMVISGIVKAEDTKGISKVPYLGDIPILGELFRSRAFNNSQSELVVFVTPRLTAPELDINQKVLKPAMEQIEQLKSSTSINSALLD